MTDFINSKEIQQISLEEADLSKQSVEVHDNDLDLGKTKEQEITQQEQKGVKQKIPEQTGKVVSLRESIAQENPATKTERQQDIERILSKGEDIKDIYSKLNQDDQQKVKARGEEAAEEIEKFIEEMIKTGKDVSKNVLEEVRDWMNEIPGVNKYFLLQESKKKTDLIIALAKKEA